MPRYKFVGWSETVLTGLAHGVNAVLHREEHGQPDGSTVVAQPGDEIETDEPYPHAWMVNEETGKTDLPDVADPASEPVEEAPAEPVKVKKPRARRQAAQTSPAASSVENAPPAAEAPDELAAGATDLSAASSTAPTEGQE